jgi:hypothetical protein
MSDPEANERFIATAAVPLLLLLAIEGVTLLFLRPLLPVHVFVGILIVLPVVLKLATTGWRFVRYYGGDEEYVRHGAPRPLMRILAPPLVVSTLAVLATGIALVFTSGHAALLLQLHKLSFIVWGPLFGIHVLAYIRHVPRLVLTAARAQRVATFAVVALGLIAAMLGYTAGHPELHGWFHADIDSDGDRF